MNDNIIIDSIFNHLFMEELKENAMFLVIAPTARQLKNTFNEILDKIVEWGLEYTARYTYGTQRIDIEDITIRFIAPDSTGGRGLSPDYVFLIDSETFSDETNQTIDFTFRPHAVVIG